MVVNTSCDTTCRLGDFRYQEPHGVLLVATDFRNPQSTGKLKDYPLSFQKGYMYAYKSMTHEVYISYALTPRVFVV